MTTVLIPRKTLFREIFHYMHQNIEFKNSKIQNDIFLVQKLIGQSCITLLLKKKTVFVHQIRTKLLVLSAQTEEVATFDFFMYAS